MTTIATEIAAEVTTVAESVGRNELAPMDALSKICLSLIERIDFSQTTAIWQLTNSANDVLAELLPEKKEVFVRPGDRSGPAGNEDIGEDYGSKIIARAIFRGLKLFDTNGLRKHGATELLDICPNPIAKSDTPFVDARGQWDHTHTKSGE